MPTTDRVERGIVEQVETEEESAKVVDDVWCYNFTRC